MKVEIVKSRSLAGFDQLGNIELFEQQVVILINEGFKI